MKEMYFQSFSHSESLQNVPIPISVWYRINSEFPRSIVSLENFQVLCVIWSKMNGSFHWRRHEQSSYQPILMICYLQVMIVLLCVHLPHQFPGTWARRLIPVFLIPGCVIWVFSCRLTWENSIGSRLVFLISFLILIWTPICFSSAFPWLAGSLRSFGGFFLASNGLCSTRFMGLDFDIAGLVGSGFAIGEPSLDVASCLFFAMAALCFLIGSESKLLKWLQENIEKFKMLNKRRRWFHSWRVKLPLVSMSTSWFSVSTYLVWIFRPKLTLSNNQSRATLWVLDTCLTVGLSPLMIILITASSSSRMYNWDSPWEECVFSPRLVIDQHLGCSFLHLCFQRLSWLVFWFWFCYANGLLSRTSCLELIYHGDKLITNRTFSFWPPIPAQNNRDLAKDTTLRWSACFQHAAWPEAVPCYLCSSDEQCAHIRTLPCGIPWICRPRTKRWFK